MIKLAKPYIPESAIRKVVNVLRSGNLVQGKYVKEFETELEKYLVVRNAIAVSSGTAALHLSLIALNIKQGDEVIVPAFTFPATANVVELVGAKPVFVDITLDDFCIDPTIIKDKITKKTKAIMPVHEFGQSADIEKIISIAQNFNLKIIEDAACALGTEFSNQKVGNFGDLGCFSFHPRKAITTGEGGLISTNNDMLADKIRSLRNHGISNNKGKIDFIYAGCNYRMTEFQAVLGFYQLSELDKIINNRINIAEIYYDKLKSIKWVKTPPILRCRKSVYQTYHILIDEKISRDDLINILRKKGIETNLGAQALPCLTYYKKKYDLKEKDFPNAYIAYKKGLALPIGMHISIEDVNFVKRELEFVYNNLVREKKK